MNLTEAEDIKKRWQEYTEELYKKNLHDPDNHIALFIWIDSYLVFLRPVKHFLHLLNSCL